jgi:hypothetical protein
MSDLHWTGAALLLAIAALGGSSSRARRDTELTWEEFARANGIAREDGTAAPSGALAPPGPAIPSVAPAPDHPVAPSERTTWLRATAICGHCGRAAGDLEWDAAAPAKRAVLRPAGGAPTRVMPLGARLRCQHCGGPVFAEEPEPIVVRPSAALAAPRRGRPRKAAQRAS